jgi:uncharacterized protein YjiS (DUF1127 family)
MAIHLNTCGRRLAQLRHAVANWVGRVRERRALAAMDDRALRELGRSRYELAAEIARWRWRT